MEYVPPALRQHAGEQRSDEIAGSWSSDVEGTGARNGRQPAAEAAFRRQGDYLVPLRGEELQVHLGGDVVDVCAYKKISNS